jgi:hypothetical protein
MVDINGLTDRPVVTIDKKYFNENLSAMELSHHLFVDTGAIKITFENVDFSHCVFKNAYFKGCKFIECNFTGAQFESSNFRGSRFENCKFIFSVFRNTEISHKELLVNLSEWPNNNREWLRRLRINAESIGDVEAVKSFVKEEMLASREHLKKARAAKEGYYRKKYKRWDKRLTVYLDSIINYLDWHLWGHGEHPHKLAFTILGVISLSSVYVFLQNEGVSIDAKMNDLLSIAWVIVTDVSQTFVGVKSTGVDNGLAAILSLVRYISLGLFTSVLYKSIGRR